MSELKELIENMGQGFEQFKAKYDGRVDAMQRQLEAIETAVARRQFPGGGSSSRGGGFGAEAKEHEKQFYGWMRSGSGADALRGLEIKASLSTLSDPDGGFLVPEEVSQEIDRVAMDSLAMRRIARIVRATGDYKRPASQGGATGGWVAEKQARPETSSPTLTMFEPPFCEQYAMPAVTQSLLDMTNFDVAGWLSEEINTVIIENEGEGFITGNGVGRPKGILSYEAVANASWAWGKIGYIASGHASLLNNVDKLKALKYSLKPVYRRNAVWLMNDSTQEVISNFKNGQGDYIWKQGLTEDAPDTLLGRPVEIDDNMPDIGAGTYPIAFGDFKRAYTIVDHTTGVRLLRDPYTNKPFVNFYTTKRVAGGVYNSQAIKLMKIAAA
jgi:HK97 family phage major capsid protein